MNSDLLVLCEDESGSELWPLTATRPVWALRIGARCLWEKTQAVFGTKSVAIDIQASSENRRLVALAEAESCELSTDPESVSAKGSVLWWNGAALPPLSDPTPPGTKAQGIRWVDRSGKIAGLRSRAAGMSASSLRELLRPGSSLPSGWDEIESDISWIEFPWDPVRFLKDEIVRDAKALGAATGSSGPAGCHVLGKSVSVAAKARVEPGCVLDSRSGPIVIDESAVIEPLTHLSGPAYVGKSTWLLGGKLSQVALGPECRVGGEVEATLFQGYANKRHQGFLGHAWVGEWVNLGAMTANSDLKNNYGLVRVRLADRELVSGETKVGCFLGDHVKSGIGSLLPTGGIVGPGSNLFGGGRFAPKFVPGWAWWDGEKLVPHEWEKFLLTARAAMGRRAVVLTPSREAALRSAWTKGPRAS